MALNINDAFQKMSQATQNAETELESFMGTMDSSDSADLMELQRKMQHFTMATNLQSNTLKTISEAMKSIISNMR